MSSIGDGASCESYRHSSMFEMHLAGATSASVTVFDVLGRVVNQFDMAASYDWNCSALPAGTYFIEAESGASRVSLYVVRN
ncbi:MAG: T9SS type A sorting domain-containing protein [Rhabdochlamydiaceae bacterium]